MITRHELQDPIRKHGLWKSVRAVLLIGGLLVSSGLFAYTPVSGTITLNTDWTAGTYYVTDNVTVQIGVTLTINPGVVVKFAPGRWLTVDGALNAPGTAGNRIIFTSNKDDLYGEDVLADGASTPAIGDWGGITITSTASPTFTHTQYMVVSYASTGLSTAIALTVDHCDFQWCTRGFYASAGSQILADSVFSNNTDKGAYLYAGGNVAYTITNCSFDDNGGTGLHVYGSSSTVDFSLGGSFVRRNGNHGILFQSYAAFNTAITGNTITDNKGYGIYRDNYSAGVSSRLSGNTITGNRRPFRLALPLVPLPADGNTLVPNQSNIIEITGGTVGADFALNGFGSGADEIRTYLIDESVTINAGAILTVNAGLILKFKNTGITVNGALIADGTPAQPIVFTAAADDAYGGDTNEDGIATGPKGGDWQGLDFNNSAIEASNLLDNAVIRYASDRQVDIYAADFTVSNTSIACGSGDGLYIYNASPTLTNLSIFGNAGDGVEITSTSNPAITSSRVFRNHGYGILVGSSGNPNPVVHSSEIFGNRLYGFQNNSSNTVDATGNFWGAADGPGGSGPGSGDDVSANVNTSGFLVTGTDFRYFDVGGAATEGFQIGAPALSQGTSSNEFGTTEPETMAWHNDQVILDFSGLSPAAEYHVLLTLLNKDSVTGGNILQILDASGNLLHSGMTLPNYTPSRYELTLLPGAVSGGGTLTLKFDRVNGYRAVVNEILIWKTGTIGDSTAPVSSITAPTAGQSVRGTIAVIRTSTADAPVSSGIASIELSTDNGSTWNGSTILTSDGHGAHVWTLPADGNYILRSRARDNAGNLESPGAGIAVRVDNDAPQAVADFTAADTPLDLGGSVSLAWTQSTDDGAGDNDLDHYEIYRTTYPGRFHTLVTTRPAGSESYADITAVTGTWYYYKIRSVDTAGNTRDTAECPRVRAVDNSIPDTQAPEDVTNLTAFAGDQQVLLNWTPSINTDGDLADQRLYISKDDGVTWGNNPPDFNNGLFTSLGPSVTTHTITGLVNSQPYKFKITVVDAVPNESAGAIAAATPTNTVTILSGTISSNATYLPGIFRVTGTVTIAAGVVINVQPGVIFKFNPGTSMIVNGALNADGTSTSKIIFTSIKDDVGGDTNGDGGATTPAAGDWQRVSFGSGATAASCLMDYAEIRYAGQTSNSALTINAVSFDVTNCHIHHCAYRGLELQGNTSPKITGNTIEYCGADGIYHVYGSYSITASQAIQNNIIRYNTGHGLYFSRGTWSSATPDKAAVAGNQLVGNTGDGIRVEASASYFSWTVSGNTIADNGGYGMAWGTSSSPVNLAGPIRNNTLTGNGKLVRTTANMLPDDASNTLTTAAPLKVWEIVGDTIVGDRRIDAKMGGADTINTYLVSRNNITVDTGTRLYVDPGVVMKFEANRSMMVNGVLRIEGTAGQKAVFTSYRDDEWHGDTNGDGPSTPQKSDWSQIQFSGTAVGSLCIVNHAVIRYAAYGIYSSVTLSILNTQTTRCDRGLYLTGPGFTVTGCDVSNNTQDGIYINSSSGTVAISSTTMADNGGSGGYLYFTGTATIAITGNVVSRNGSHGINFPYAWDSGPYTLSGNTITDNAGYGIYRSDGTGGTCARLSGNTITGNKRPYRLPITMVPEPSDGNILAPNRQNVVELTGGTLTNALTMAVLNPGTQEEIRTYRVLSGITVASGGGLTLQAGLIFKFESVGLTVNSGGKLQTAGTASAPVVFTAYEDDFFGGDSDENGTADAPNPGDWTSLTINSGALAGTLDGCFIRFGDRVYLYASGVTLANSSISSMASYGIYLSGYSGTIQNNRIWGNFGDGIYASGTGSPVLTGNEISLNHGDGIELSSSGGGALINGNEIFSNQESGLEYPGAPIVNATGNWWGHPGGAVPGDGLTGANINAGSPLVTGTAYAYTDSGGTTAEGFTLAQPSLLQGTPGQEFGASADRSMLFDPEQVRLRYTGLDSGRAYELRMVYWNSDNTTGQGGNVQTALSGVKQIHGPIRLPAAGTAPFFGFRVPYDTYAGGSADIVFDRQSGYRAVVQETALLDRGLLTDTSVPASAITQPANGARLGGSLTTIRGTFTDMGSGLAHLEIGINNGSVTTWSEATVTGGGTTGWWTFDWTLPSTGAYTLTSRATDKAGNIETPGAPVTVTIDQVLPRPATGLSAVDHPGDTGGAIDLSWTLSLDDGAGASDVVQYDLYRTAWIGRDYVYVASVPAGTSVYTDSTTTDGVGYYYVIDARDTGGLKRRSSEYGPIASYDNTLPDAAPPSDPSSFTAVAGDGLVELEWTRSSSYSGDLANQRLYVSTNGGANWGNDFPAYANGGFFLLGKEALTHQFTQVNNGTAYTFKLVMVDNVPNESAGKTASATPQANIYFSVSGTIASNTHWKSGIYRVTGALTIAAGATLTIDPCVIVKFNAGTSLTINGALYAVGTPGCKVLFTSIRDDVGGDTNGDGGATTPAAGDWQRIYYGSGATATACQLDYIEIRYAGQSSYAALYIYGLTFDITNCHIHHCLARGLEIAANGSPKLTGNTIEYCGGDGIYHSYGSYSASVPQPIQDNFIRFNTGHGLYFSRGTWSSAAPDAAVVTGNQLVGNTGDGMRVEASAVYFSWIVNSNTITGNGGYGMAWGVGSNAPSNLAGPIRNNTITGNGKLIRTTANMLPDDSSNTLTTTAPLKVWEIAGDTIVGDRRLDAKMGGADTIVTYLVSRNNIIVDTGTRLFVDPGIVVKFETGRELTVNGVLRIEGTAGEKAYFTSYRDDEWRGDTNGDGPSTPQRGDWSGIQFSSSAVGSLCTIAHAAVRYANYAIQSSVALIIGDSQITRSNRGIYITGSSLTVAACDISGNTNDGIYVSTGSGTLNISGSTLSDNGGAGAYLYCTGAATIALTGNTVSRNGSHGIHFPYAWDSGQYTISGNTIQDNTGYGIYRIDGAGGTSARLSGNTITGNKRPYRLPITMVPEAVNGNILTPNRQNVIEITGGTLANALTLQRISAGTAEELKTFIMLAGITIGSGGSLTVEPGIYLKFDGSSTALTIASGGALNATGTALDPIVFTSSKDDFYGGDTDENGTAAAAGPYDWGIMDFAGGASSSTLDGCIIRFGYRITISSSAVTLRNCDISNAYQYGFYISGSSPRLENNRIWGNLGDGINGTGTGSPIITGNEISLNRGDGMDLAAGFSGALITQNNLFSNKDYGIRYAGATLLNAKQNWWGHPGGAASGDGVLGNVDVSNPLAAGPVYAYKDLGGALEEQFTLAAPTVPQGTASAEFGPEREKTMVWHADEVQIRFTGLNAARLYEVRIAYLNQDNTGTAGNVQTLSSAGGGLIHGGLRLPSTYAAFQSFILPSTAYAAGTLDLRADRLSGLRAVANEIALLDRGALGDTTVPTSTITIPSDDSVIRGTTFNVRGSYTDGASKLAMIELGINDGTGIVWRKATVATEIAGDRYWTYAWTLPRDGIYELSSRATDDKGNVEIPKPPISVRVDNDPPRPPFNPQAADVLGDNGEAIKVTWELSPDDGSGDNDVVRYDIYRTTTPGWSYVLSGTAAAGTAFFTDTTAADGINYWFKVRVYDTAGNSSETLEFGPAQAYDNLGSADGTAPPNPTAFTALPGYDFLGSAGTAYLRWTPGANPDGDRYEQRLYISRDGGANYGSNAPLFNNNIPIPMGRDGCTYQVLGLGLGIAYRFKLTSMDWSQNESAGVTADATPLTTSFITIADATLCGNTRWKRGIFYLPNSVTVPAGSMLQIDGGTIIKVAVNRSLTINGYLRAVGTAGAEVVFTSYKDDAYGGDTNGDGSATSPAPGDWTYLDISPSGALALNELAFVSVKYATRTNITNADGTVVRNSSFGRCSSYGLYINSSDNVDVTAINSYNNNDHGLYAYNNQFLEITGGLITGNGGSGMRLYLPEQTSISGTTIQGNAVHGILLDGSGAFSGTIKNCSIQSNGSYGIYMDTSLWGSPGPIKGNTIINNRKPARLLASALPNNTDGNTLAPNQTNILEISGTTIVQDKSLEVLNPSTSAEVRVYGVPTGTVTVDNGVTLTLNPGVILKFNTSLGLTVNGAMKSQGTAAQPVILTHWSDDAHGGDTNEDTYLSAPRQADWNGITFNSSAVAAASLINYTNLYYGQLTLYVSVPVSNSTIASGSLYGIHVYNSAPQILNCRIWGHRRDGIYIYGGSAGPTITGSRIWSNGQGDPGATTRYDGIYVSSSVNGALLTITNNEIFGNYGDGLDHDGTNTVNAQNNWWGHASGPGGDAPGSGDEVRGSVNYANYLITGTPYSYRNFSAGAPGSAGSLPLPTITQGTESDEWDSSNKHPGRTMIWHNNAIILNYAGLNTAMAYQVKLTYFNQDAVTPGNITTAVGNAGTPIHNRQIHPQTYPTQYLYNVPSAAYSGGNMALTIDHINAGTSYRATLSEIWLLENGPAPSDTTAPASSIGYPADLSAFPLGTLIVMGTAADDAGPGASGLAGVDLGVFDGSSTIWTAATTLTGDGSWTFTWTPPAQGAYTLYSRAVDNAGNYETPLTAVHVTMGTPPPNPVPTVTSVNPNTGANTAPVPITVIGTGFLAGAVFRIGDVFCQSLVVDSSTQISCSVPAGLNPGVYTVKVTNTDGQFGTKSSAYTVTGVAQPPQPPVADAGPDQTVGEGSTVVFNGTNSYDPNGTALTYRWDFDNDAIYGTTDNDVFGQPDDGTGATPGFAFFPGEGIYTVGLQVTDGAAQTGTDTMTLTIVNVAPSGSITSSPSAIAGFVKQLQAVTGDPGGDPVTTTWDLDNDGLFGAADTSTFGQPSDGIGLVPTVTFLAPGNYPIRARFTDNASAFTTVSQLILVSASYFANAGSDFSVNEGAPAFFSGSAAGGTPPYAYAWAFGDGQNGAGAGCTHAYADNQPGNAAYTVTLTVTDSLGVVATDAVLVTVLNVTPIANIGGPYTAGDDVPVTLDGSQSSDRSTVDRASLTYEWDFDYFGGFTIDGTGVQPTTTFTIPSTYTIALRVRDKDGATSFTSTTTVTVSAEDVRFTSGAGLDKFSYRMESEDIYITASDSAKVGQGSLTVALSDSVTGDDETVTLTETPASSGQFRNAAGIPTDGAGPATDQNGILETLYGHVIQVNYLSRSDSATMIGSIPIAAAGPDQIVAQSQTVNLDGIASYDPEGGALTYAWDFDYDGVTFTADAAGSAASTTYPLPGIYTAALRVTDPDADQAVDTAVITVDNVAPVAEAGGPYGGIVGGLVVFDGSGSSDAGTLDTLTYAWDFNYDGSFNPTGSGSAASTTYGSAGAYTVALRVTDQHGWSSGLDTATVTIGTTLIATASKLGDGVEGSAIGFTGSAAGGVPPYSYSWSFPPDGAVSSAQNPFHVFPDSGAFQVYLQVTDNIGATDDTLVAVTVANANPTAAAGGPYTVQTDVILPFDGSASSDPGTLDVLSYYWDKDYSGTFAADCSGMTNPPCQQSTPGIYTFALQVKDDDGGESIATGSLTVVVSPIRFANAGWESVSQYCPVNEDIYVEIYDLSRDLNILAPDALIATVVNSTTTDTETMTLAETGNSTSIFRGTLNLVDSATHASGNSLMEAQGGDAIQLQYTDPANNQDTSTKDGAIMPGSCEIHLTVTKSGGAAHLSWTGISGSYQVRRSIDGSFGTYEAFVPIGGPTGTTYDDPDFPPSGNIFYYLVENQ